MSDFRAAADTSRLAYAGHAEATDRPRGPRITYFSLSFPELTQTFVFNEMRHLKALGADIDVVALRPPRGDMSDLPQRYGFGERIAYADPAIVVRNKTQRVGLAARSSARLIAAGRGAGVWRLVSGGRRKESLTRSLSLNVAASFQRAGGESELVLCHFGPAGRVAAQLKAKGLLRARLVTVFHGYDVTQYLEGKPAQIYRELFEQADLLIAISDLWRQRLIDLGAPPERVVTLRLGIDCRAFDYRARRIVEGGPIRLASVGRLTEKKGHRYTLAAFAALLRRRPELDLRLDIAGSGPLFAELQSAIAQLGLEGRARLLGGISHGEVRDVLEGAHAFVLHSVTAADGDMEGIPVSIMEAMAMGLPVASTRHSGITELVEDGVSGLLVDERDSEAFSAALERLVTEPDLSERMGRAGRTIIERDYNAAIQAGRLMQKLQGLVASTSSTTAGAN